MLNKRVIISGGSRGIGLEIAKKLASLGAKIAILSRTVEEVRALPGTIYTAAAELEALGAEILPIPTDIRSEAAVREAVDLVVEKFGGIDILINNAGVVSLIPTLPIDMKRFDLMHDVNVRGTFLLSKVCVPHLAKGDNPQILNICPPLEMKPEYFMRTLPYSLSKFGMSQCVLGMSQEFKGMGIAVNGLWPHSLVATAAISNVVGGEIVLKHCRNPKIMADAAAIILGKDAKVFTGIFHIDDVVLDEAGVTDFSVYRVNPRMDLWSDYFMEFPDIPHNHGKVPYKNSMT